MNRYTGNNIIRSIQRVILTGFVLLAACSTQPESTSDRLQEKTPAAETETLMSELSVYSDQIKRITDLILEGIYSDAGREINLIRFGLETGSKPRSFFNNLYSFVVLEEKMQEAEYDKARSMFRQVDSTLLPEELISLYEETAAQLPGFYEKWLEEHPPGKIQGADTYLYTEEEFRSYVDSLASDLKNKDFRSARKTVNHLVENKTRWNSNDAIPEKLIDTYFAMAWYTDCIIDYNSGQFIQASGCLIGLEHLKSDLPSALQQQFDEYAKSAANEARVQQYMNEFQNRKKKEERKNQISSGGCDDEYNACEYSDAYEFYYWNEDFFMDYEDAEDYWISHH